MVRAAVGVIVVAMRHLLVAVAVLVGCVQTSTRVSNVNRATPGKAGCYCHHMPDANAAAFTKALADLVDAKLRVDYAPWYPGGASQDPPRIDLYATEPHGDEYLIRFIADSYVYNQAQSGSDWADHYVYAGTATCKGSRILEQSFALVEHEHLTESQSDGYDAAATVARVKERIR